MTKEDLIQQLGLEPHPLEGGYFKRTYESSIGCHADGNERKLMTSIYYLLTTESPIGYLHKNKSDIVHFYHLGGPANYFLISPNGEILQKRLGPNLANGEQLQLLVPGGYWKASTLCDGEFSLISEAVSPGFDYADNQLATIELIDNEFPQLIDQCKPYIAK